MSWQYILHRYYNFISLFVICYHSMILNMTFSYYWNTKSNTMSLQKIILKKELINVSSHLGNHIIRDVYLNQIREPILKSGSKALNKKTTVRALLSREYEIRIIQLNIVLKNKEIAEKFNNFLTTKANIGIQDQLKP